MSTVSTGSTGSTVDRRAITDALNRLAFAAELLDDNSVDAKGVSALAWTMRQAEGELTLERVSSMDGVSVPVFAVIDDVAAGRTPPLLTALEARVPRGLLEVRRLKGLGPRKIRALWQELDVTSLGELEYACQENRLVDLKGFGDKTQASVLEQIEALRAQAGLVRLDQALATARVLVDLLEKAGGRAAVAGEARRCMEVVRRLVIVTSLDESAARAAAGDAVTHAGVEVAFVAAVPAHRFGAALVVATGSDAHVNALRARATEKGLVLEEIVGTDDAAVYAALGLVELEPERREAHVPLVERGKARPRLVTRLDLVGALHNHTTASDGTASMREMRDAAARLGLRYLGITDHSQSAVYARGLAASSLDAQRAEARALNDEPAPTGGAQCVILAGVESDILKDGSLDYPDDVLRKLDVVIASVHARFGQKGADLTSRMIAAANHPRTDVVGHPTGRLLLGRAPSEYDVSAFLEACARTGVSVELNANPARLDLNEAHLAEAKERKILVSIAADAHSTDALAHLDYGVAIARRAGLGPEDVLNTRGVDDVRALFDARRGRSGA